MRARWLTVAFMGHVREPSPSVSASVGGPVTPEQGAQPPKSGKQGKRVQVAGPQQVTREQWERKVEAMMLVRVSADGKPSAVESFALASAGADDWEEWNRERDTR